MSRATVELDFLGIDKDASSKSRFQKLLHRNRSTIHTAISKINPHLLKSLISYPSTRPTSETLPLPETSPMTIFYNGTVAVFDVSPHKAESILKLVAEGTPEADPTAAFPSSDHQQHLLASLNGDLPIARKKSLQRFLEKRKERLTTASPYGCPHLT